MASEPPHNDRDSSCRSEVELVEPAPRAQESAALFPGDWDQGMHGKLVNEKTDMCY